MVTAASLEAEVTVNGGAQVDHLFQARLPLRLYEWLRTQWYEQRVPMNSVVTAAVHALREGRIDLEQRALSVTVDEDEATQRFTVRMSVVDYEWLRVEAFRRRVSINKLLAVALDAPVSASASETLPSYRQ